jgi:hypothetical protein
VLTVDGLTFAGIRSGGGMPLVQISDDNPTGRGETHIRNLKLVDWSGSRDRAVINRGGGPRPTPKTEKGVSIYVHDWFGAGRTARVVSTKAPDAAVTGGPEYKAVPQLTGDESRAVEVGNVEFPKLLDPVDDLPPQTVITRVVRFADGKVVVRGVCADNGVVKRVVVNGKEATAVRANFAEWEIVLEGFGSGELKLTAHAEDGTGNVETRAHTVMAAK